MPTSPRRSVQRATVGDRSRVPPPLGEAAAAIALEDLACLTLTKEVPDIKSDVLIQIIISLLTMEALMDTLPVSVTVKSIVLGRVKTS